MKVILSIIIALTASVKLYSQNFNNNWYFGDNAGITFNTIPPSAITNGQISTQEGCAAISDNNGNLLFYTDGTTIYNRNHIVMPNGSGLWGDFSSTQSAVIVPQPNSNRYYYVFTLDAFAGPNGFSYSIVDMQAASGFGDVTVKNVQLLSPASEKLTVIKHSNNQDFWIVIHGWNNNTFHAFLLSDTGINTTPVNTSIGIIHSGGGGTNNAANAIGYMKASSDGTMIALAIAIEDIYELFEFDNSTGTLSNLVTITDPDNNASTCLPYGLEFSPSSEYLYLKNMYSQNVYQYNVSIYNQTSITNSKQLVGSVSGTYYYYTGAMQLGPDNKIYIAQEGLSSLAKIDFPDNPAATCGLVDNAIPLATKICRLGLPCIVLHTSYNNPDPEILSDGCFLGPYTFWLDDTAGINNVFWNFDDPSSSINTSNDFEPEHIFSTSGTYNIYCIYTTLYGNSDTIFFQLNTLEPPQIITEDSIGICNGNPTTIYGEPGFDSYLWSNGSNSQNTSISVPGVYFVTATINGCTVTDSIFADFTTIDQVDLGNDTIICSGESIQLDAGFIGYNYLWNNGSTSYSISANQTGIYSVIISDNGCEESDSIYLTVQNVSVELGPTMTLCASDVISLVPLGNYISLLWDDGSSGLTLNISAPGIYSVTAFIGNCATTDSIQVLPCSEIWFPNVFTPNGDNNNPMFTGMGINIVDFHMMIFNRWGQLLYETNNIYNGWDGTFKGQDCAQGVYFYVADYQLYTNSGLSSQTSQGSVTLFR